MATSTEQVQNGVGTATTRYSLNSATALTVSGPQSEMLTRKGYELGVRTIET